MRILGIDPAGSFGWGVLEDGNVVEHGVLKLTRDVSAGLVQLKVLVRDWRPDKAVIEGVSFVKFTGAHASYWRIRTLVELACQSQEVELVVCEVPVLKRWATGKGNAKKADMCAAARLRLGVSLFAVGEEGADPVKAEAKRQEDQADALLCAAWLNAYRPD